MENNAKGFTLIELMIVIAIIGILATIALPQFNSYRLKAFDATSKSDLSVLATEMENYFLENTTYASNVAAISSFSWSNNVSGEIASTSIDAFTATAKHSSSTKTFTYSSNGGGLWN